MFYFVDSNSSSKEKRAHVMRHHVQEKRKQRKLSQGAVQTEQDQEPRSSTGKTDFEYDTNSREEAALMKGPGSSVPQNSSVWESTSPLRLFARRNKHGLQNHSANGLGV